MQQRLADTGFNPGPIDGIYGPATERAIERFERSRDRDPSGRATATLLTELRALTPKSSIAAPKPQLATPSSPEPRRSTGQLPQPATVLPALPGARGGPTLRPAEIYARSSNSVWVVVAGASVAAFEQQHDLWQGSAVAVAPDRLLTNCHVVYGREIVVIGQGDARDLAEVIASDTRNDRCVLEPHELRLRPVQGIRHYTDLEIGERAFTIGSPSGLERSLGEGLISGLRAKDDIALIGDGPSADRQVPEGLVG